MSAPSNALMPFVPGEPYDADSNVNTLHVDCKYAFLVRSMQ